MQPPSARRGGRAALWWAGAAAAVLSVWCGCTVTKTNYKTLSFLFDGVPDPDLASAKNNAGDATIAVAVIVHKPFAEEKCEACHRTQYRPGKNDPTACLSCHTTVMNQHAWTHGAVAGGACLWCHSPHESARKWLLRAPDRKVCSQCHSATMMNASTVPAHADPAVSCLACHFGHGGDNSLMLRPGATAQTIPPPSDEPEKADRAVDGNAGAGATKPESSAPPGTTPPAALLPAEPKSPPPTPSGSDKPSTRGPGGAPAGSGDSDTPDRRATEPASPK